MAVVRVKKSTNYTTMSNFHFKEKTMSLKAKGLISLMLSLPENWDYSIEGLTKICKENETSIKSALDELKQFGYLKVTKLKPNETTSGRFEYVYVVYEQPQKDENDKKNKEQEGEKQGVENLGLEFLGLENQGQLNTEELNTNNSDTRYNNHLEKEINKENIINKEDGGICNSQNPVPSKSSIFTKQSSSTRTDELKKMMSDKISSSKQTPSEKAMGKNARILENLQSYILKLDEPQEVKNCYCQWLKILAENKKLMTKDQLVLAIEYLNRETSDKEVKIEAIKLASMKGYRDFEWVINKAIENIKGDPNDFLHLGGKNKEYTKISDIAARQAEEFRKEMEAHPEKYVVPEFF